jgi:hypothetical protein
MIHPMSHPGEDSSIARVSASSYVGVAWSVFSLLKPAPFKEVGSMSERRFLRFLSAVIGLTVPLLLAGSVAAVDGVIEINQEKALAGGVTAGDAAGFPVLISVRGSYRLTSDLDLTVVVDPPNTSAIEITTDDVTLDLNGFVIHGTTFCGGVPVVTSCSPTGTGMGVDATGRRNVSVSNGTIRGMGSHGFGASSPSTGDSRVENVRASNNGGAGIRIGNQCLVKGNTTIRNGWMGIFAGNQCMVKNNVAEGNNNNGIQSDTGSTMIDNVSSFNGGTGVLGNIGSTLIGNTATNNTGVGIYTAQGVISQNTATENDGDGISGTWSTVVNSTAIGNGGDGIQAQNAATVIGNTSQGNTGFGLRLGPGTPSAYTGNNVDSNTAGTVTGGFQIGTNGCNGNTTCP